jgi:hypothetical protein
MMLLVLAVGLVAGLAVQIVRTRRTPRVFVPHGGGGGGDIKGTDDGGVEIDQTNWFFGEHETARPIRWVVFINRVPDGQDDRAFFQMMEARWKRTLFKINVDPASTVFEAVYGTPSVPRDGKLWAQFATTFPAKIPATCKAFQATLHKTLPLKLPPGVYYISVVARDGLKIRDKTGKIVDRDMFGGGGSSTSRVVIHERGGGLGFR